MFEGILRIALLCVLIGSASIPLSFTINSSPVVVWLGNALGSLFSAIVVIYIGDRITDKDFTDKLSKRRLGKKVVTAFEEGGDNKRTLRVRIMIDQHGLKIFSFLCPIFPGMLIATSAVYILRLDKDIFKRWSFAGIFFASGAYVFGYWFFFVK